MAEQRLHERRNEHKQGLDAAKARDARSALSSQIRKQKKEMLRRSKRLPTGVMAAISPSATSLKDLRLHQIAACVKALCTHPAPSFAVLLRNLNELTQLLGGNGVQNDDGDDDHDDDSMESEMLDLVVHMKLLPYLAQDTLAFWDDHHESDLKVQNEVLSKALAVFNTMASSIHVRHVEAVLESGVWDDRHLLGILLSPSQTLDTKDMVMHIVGNVFYEENLDTTEWKRHALPVIVHHVSMCLNLNLHVPSASQAALLAACMHTNAWVTCAFARRLCDSHAVAGILPTLTKLLFYDKVCFRFFFVLFFPVALPCPILL